MCCCCVIIIIYVLLLRLYKERLSQVDIKLQEVMAGCAQEYLEPLANLQENMQIRTKVAGESKLVLGNELWLRIRSRHFLEFVFHIWRTQQEIVRHVHDSRKMSITYRRGMEHAGGRAARKNVQNVWSNWLHICVLTYSPSVEDSGKCLDLGSKTGFNTWLNVCVWFDYLTAFVSVQIKDYSGFN